MKTESYKGYQISSGFLSPGYWAKSGSIYEGGYRSERQAINAVKRKLDKK